MSVGLLTEVSMIILVSFIDSKPITKFCVGCPPIWEIGGFQNNYFQLHGFHGTYNRMVTLVEI